MNATHIYLCVVLLASNTCIIVCMFLTVLQEIKVDVNKNKEVYHKLCKSLDSNKEVKSCVPGHFKSL